MNCRQRAGRHPDPHQQRPHRAAQQDPPRAARGHLRAREGARADREQRGVRQHFSWCLDNHG